MKRYTALLLIAAIVLSGCAAYTRRDAPPPQAELKQGAPCPEAKWVTGHWTWEGKRSGYRWVPGHWRCP